MKLTTVAIIGGGVAGLSLAYELAKRVNPPQKILVFDSDSFAPTCSLRSTAIVAPRGVSAGHSDLGDELMAAFECFKAHVREDQPAGIFPITQFSGAHTKLEAFQRRYPNGRESVEVDFISLTRPTYVAEEEAFLVDPAIYLGWLKNQASSSVTSIDQFVLEVSEAGTVKTQEGSWQADQIVFAGGAHNPLLANVSSKKVQGAYFEFSNVDFGTTSISVTLDGDNLVYHAHAKRLLIGSTTDECSHLLPNRPKLEAIYQRLRSQLKVELPPMADGTVRVGLREKAPQRRPYLVGEGNRWAIGGYYKSGWSLALYKARQLSTQLR